MASPLDRVFFPSHEVESYSREQWERFKALYSEAFIVDCLCTDPTRVCFQRQYLYASLMTAWLTYEGPLPERKPTPTFRQLKREKDKLRNQRRQAEREASV